MTRGRRVVSIVGATGLVGSEVARILLARRFPLQKLLLFSSGRQKEKKTTLFGRTYAIETFEIEAPRESQICFLAAGSGFSRKYAASIRDLGNVVIDNSSAFRMSDGVPLVVPEVNGREIAGHRGIIANPNCTTIQMVLVLARLHRIWGLRRIIVSTYQSVSGAGLRACGELMSQTSSLIDGQAVQASALPQVIGFNLFPEIDRFDTEGWTGEERKIMDETRKILGDDSIDVVATAVRVPVFRCHSESVYAEFRERVDLAMARRILDSSGGVKVVDDPEKGVYPMPIDCAGKDEAFVGRLRRDPRSPNALCMWIVSDNLRKGAALNAVQIAERLIQGYGLWG